MKNMLEEKLNIIKQKGHFLTSSRMKILEYLMNTESHPTADEIYNYLKKDLPSLSKATVYNTLKLFVELGIAHELKVEREKSRYEARTTPHIHFSCVKCKTVYDIDNKITQMPNEIEGHRVMFSDVFLYGICKKCLKKGRS
jgi:Fe2+ or Zn2+ uptake regulation protein